MTDETDRAREEFFSEAQELLERLGTDLLALDEGQRTGRVDPERINDIFRGVHTLKGLTGLFGAQRMAALSHDLESLLDDLRLGRRTLTAELLDNLFQALELFGRLLLQEKEGTEQPIPDVENLVSNLVQSAPPPPDSSGVADFDLDPSLLAVLTEYEEHRLRTNIADGRSLFRLRMCFELASIDESLDQLKSRAKPLGEIITYLPTGAGTDTDSIELDILLASNVSQSDVEHTLSDTGVQVEEIARKPSEPGAAGGFPPPMPVLSVPPARQSSLAPHPERVSMLAGAQGEDTSLRSVTQTVRVDIQRLDRLMNVVGELSIVRTALEGLLDRVRASHVDRQLSMDLQRLQRSFDRNLESMQQGILEVRLVPLGQIFDKLARVSRQISREADKQVNLVFTGAETQIDKLIVEELGDPLMHMMRNAIDHGIEPRAARSRVGKPEVGTIALNAFQKGNHVVLEIEDDGAGIDTEQLVAAAVESGAIGPDEVRSTPRRDILNLVFLPGLTTRTSVTEMSGRGVGMDVVKTNISKLGGIIDIQSELGIGTKVTITLPITLAIISALLVRVGEQRFAIPLNNIQEAVTLDTDAVTLIDDRPVMTLRGTSLRLCYLSEFFQLSPDGEERTSPATAANRAGKRFVVVTSIGSSRLGLVVDGLIGGHDVVIKALGPSLKDVRGFAGAADLGDQHLGLVIDTPAIVEELLQADRGRSGMGEGARG